MSERIAIITPPQYIKAMKNSGASTVNPVRFGGCPATVSAADSGTSQIPMPGSTALCERHIRGKMRSIENVACRSVVAAKTLFVPTSRFSVLLIFALMLLGGSLFAGGEMRIVSLSPAVTELVCQLGRGRFLVGRSEVCNYPEEVKKLPAVGRYADPFLERVVALHPTIVLTNDLRSPRAAAVLRKLNIRLVVKQCRTVDEYREWVTLLGGELDCRDRAVAELRRFDGEIARLRKLPPLGLKLLWVVSESPLLTGGRTSLLSEVSQLAGMKNSGDVSEVAYFRISRDFLLKNPPDVIVWANSGAVPGGTAPFWGELEAIRRKRVLKYLHEDTVMRPGPRMPEGIRKLRREAERLMSGGAE